MFYHFDTTTLKFPKALNYYKYNYYQYQPLEFDHVELHYYLVVNSELYGVISHPGLFQLYDLCHLKIYHYYLICISGQ